MPGSTSRPLPTTMVMPRPMAWPTERVLASSESASIRRRLGHVLEGDDVDTPLVAGDRAVPGPGRQQQPVAGSRRGLLPLPRRVPPPEGDGAVHDEQRLRGRVLVLEVLPARGVPLDLDGAG